MIVLLFRELFPICYAGGMTNYLYKHKICILDYPDFANDLTQRASEQPERIAKANGLGIEFIRKNNIRKETRIKSILKSRVNRLIHIFSDKILSVLQALTKQRKQ